MSSDERLERKALLNARVQRPLVACGDDERAARKAQLNGRVQRPLVACGDDERAARKAQLNGRVQEFYNKNHDAQGRFAPSVGESIDRIGVLGPRSRFRKRDLKTLSNPQLRKLHAHLETNSRKWGAAVVGIAVASGIVGVTIGIPMIQPVMTNMSNAFLTRTRERFSVGREAQRRGIHLKFSVMEEFQQDEALEQLDKILPDLAKMSPKELSQALNDGLQAVAEILNDPDEELTAGEQKSLKDGQLRIEQALKRDPSPS